jgi:hypothetical protein
MVTGALRNKRKEYDEMDQIIVEEVNPEDIWEEW